MNGSREFLLVPRLPWLEHLFEAEGVEANWSRNRDDNLVHPFWIVGLLRVEQGIPYTGLLTQWPRETYALHEFYRRPKDGFSAKVLSIFVLDELIPVFHKFDKRSRATPLLNHDGVFLPCGLPLRILQISGAVVGEVGGPVTVAGVLHRWENPPADGIHAHMLPQPVADLAMRGRWSNLLFLTRWPQACSLFGGFPPEHVVEVANTHEVLQGPAPLRLEPPQRLIDDMRRWAPMILSSYGDEDEVCGGGGGGGWVVVVLWRW